MTFACLAIATALLSLAFPAIRRVCAYAYGTTVLIYACSLAGAALGSLSGGKDYVWPAIGFFAGVAIAIALGFPLSRYAAAHQWLFWLLLATLLYVLVQMKPLI